VLVAHVGKPSKQLGFLRSYTLQVVYNSQLLVFYSAQSPTTIYGYATNWNSTGWEEIYPQQSKLNVNVTTNDHVTFYINAKFVWCN
jgi:hypothetical protein